MTTPLISYQIRDRISGVTKELNHIKDPRRNRAINDTMTLKFTALERPNNLGYSMLENENYIICDGHEYRIKQVSKRPHYKNITCTHVFSDLVGVQRYDYQIGSKTLQECLGYLLSGTGWSYTINLSSMAGVPVVFGEDQWGKGNVVKLLQDLCNNVFHLEFEILPNKMLNFATQLSSDKGNKYEYGVNIKTIGEEFDSTSLRTKIRGTYEIVVGKDEDGNDITEKKHVTYVSPTSSVYGEIEADPISDNGVQTDSEMMAILAEKLEDTVRYSLDIDAVDFASKELGETVTINHEKMGLINSKSRILKIEDGLMYVDGEYKMAPIIITLGNYVFGTFRTKIKNKLDKLEEELNKLKKKTIGLWLSALKIHDVNCLAIPGVLLPPQAPNTPLDLENIVAEVKYKKLEGLVGLFITPKTIVKDHFIEIQMYNKDKNVTGTFSYSDSKIALETNKFPTADISYVVVTIMEKPPAEFDELKHQKQVYGVRFKKDEPLNDHLSEFRIGDLDVLGLGDVSVPKSEIIAYINDQSHVVRPPMEYVAGKVLVDIFASLKDGLTEYHITMLDSYTGWGTDYTDYYGNNVFGEGIWGSVPYGDWTGTTIVITDVPFDDLINNPSLSDTALIEAYGVIITLAEIDGLITIKCKDENGNVILIKEEQYTKPDTRYIYPPEVDGYKFIGNADDDYEEVILTADNPKATVEFVYEKDITKEMWLSEFKLGGIDLLSISGGNIGASNGSRPTASAAVAEIPFTEYNSLAPLSIKKKNEYSNFYVYVGEYFNTGGSYESLYNSANYGTDYGLPWKDGDYTTVLFVRVLEVSRTNFNPSIHASQVYAFKFVKSQNKGYTLEFATANLASTVEFTFENEDGYDTVESIVPGLIGATTSDIDLIAEPIQNATTQKFTGIRIKASTVTPNTKVSVQAVCYNEVR